MKRKDDNGSRGRRALRAWGDETAAERGRGEEESCSACKEMNSFHDIRMHQAYMMHFFWYISG